MRYDAANRELEYSTGTAATDVAVVQNRVTGFCPAGESIRVITSTGGVTCEPDDAAGGIPAGSLTGQTLYYNGTGWQASSNLFNNTTNVGIGTTTPGSKLSASGNAALGAG